ncbi:hypothetical protein PMAYCL1PPCAC_10694 [Pristionchus mayeri]|uniref:Uncharacterized protein n=1 Tax=Pristionchus mayeri TaxID=1317129 RepID=A0AAN4ZJI7_9BILA|nr:hypothetical protein PMAYCL1PPCAC_10694 [Pristionchus mayeri]
MTSHFVGEICNGVDKGTHVVYLCKDICIGKPNLGDIVRVRPGVGEETDVIVRFRSNHDICRSYVEQAANKSRPTKTVLVVPESATPRRSTRMGASSSLLPAQTFFDLPGTSMRVSRRTQHMKGIIKKEPSESALTLPRSRSHFVSENEDASMQAPRRSVSFSKSRSIKREETDWGLNYEDSDESFSPIRNREYLNMRHGTSPTMNKRRRSLLGNG